MRSIDKEIEALRARAETALAQTPESNSQAPQAMVDALRLVEELRIYQTELEIQNQDLKSAQLQTEVAMRKYKRLFENLPLEGMIIDAQGFIIEANAVARSRFSLRQQAALQRRSVYQLFSMDSRAPLHAALSSKDELTRVTQCQLAATTTSHADEVDAHLILLDTDAFVYEERLMVLVDRTLERQLAVKHEEISRSEARYRALFDKSKVPMLLVDPQTARIVRGNEAASRFYGFSAQELQGMELARINFLTDEEMQVELSLAQTESRGHFFFKHSLRDGQSVPVEVHSGPIEIDGRVLLYSIIHDISARVQAQEQADKTRQLLTNLAAQIPGAIFQLQQFPDGRFSFPFSSEGIREIYELTPDQVLIDATAVFALIHPHDFRTVKESIIDSATQLKKWANEYRVILPKQGERWHSAFAMPQRQQDGSTLWHGFVADITNHKNAELKIEAFNQDFEAFLNQTTDFVYFKDKESRFRFASKAFAEICGRQDWHEVIGTHDRDLFPSEFAEIYEREDAAIFELGTPIINKSNPYIDSTGKRGMLQTNKWPHHNNAGDLIGVFGISRDITESLLLQTRIDLAATVFTHAREGIVITDNNNAIIEVNEAFTRITGYTRREVIGQNPRILRSGRQSPQFYALMWESINTLGHWEGEIWNRRKDGALYAEMLSISAVSDKNGSVKHYLALFTDISIQKRHESELEHIAQYDDLTELPNRILLSDRLRQEMAHCQRDGKQLAVAFIDLDGFKDVNDQHGHGIGDDLLVSVAKRMKGALRDGDTLARIGGDEFVAILAHLNAAKDCEAVLTRLLECAAAPHLVNGVLIQVSASIGVTLFPQDSQVADQLLRHADHAMYEAKQAGKNRYHYFNIDQDIEVRSHKASVADISQGLDRDEFVLYYQPKVNMKTGALVGMEALIRWNHPVRGLVYPNAFLPAIDGHPLCIRLGDWVINQALKQMTYWKGMGLAVDVSVNIDGMHLQEPGFVTRLQEVLELHPEVASRQLTLEILETSALGDIDRVTQTMRQCNAMGVGFSLDDFGTGYSSLTYLKRLPADLMKIDQSFVLGMITDSDDFVIVEGVVGLAKAFGRAVLAEGVETTAHGELLLALDCELGQGYAIARPMPAVDVATWVKQWRPEPSWSIWNNPSVGADARDMVLASVKHRHWIRDVKNYINGSSDIAPPLSADECPLGVWLSGGGRERYRQHPAFNAFISAHEAVHVSAKQLAGWRFTGSQERAIEGLPTLEELKEVLIARLEALGA